MTRLVCSLPQYVVSRALSLLYLALSAVLTSPAAYAATLVVDLDSQGTAANCDAIGFAYSSIQAAVTAAAPGDTVSVCPGVYNEQVVVSTNNLRIRGAGVGSTVLQPTVVTANTTAPTTPGQVPVAPILLVSGVTGVRVSDLTIDGGAGDAGPGFVNCGFTPHFVGIYYRNASGTVESVHVTNVRSATVCAYGNRIENGPGGEAGVVYRASLVDRYSNGGIICGGLKTACTITGNTVRGVGPVSDRFQVGIAVRNGAVASISSNVVTDHFFRPGNGLSAKGTGIFLVFADPATNPHVLRDNIFANNEINLQRFSTAEVFD